jgi:hypothetical protein
MVFGSGGVVLALQVAAEARHHDDYKRSLNAVFVEIGLFSLHPARLADAHPRCGNH